MSYQKSVVLLSCCLLFSITIANQAFASLTGTPSGVSPGFPEVSVESLENPSGFEVHSALLSVLPPDEEGPIITIDPPSDVNLTGCWSDFTYSIAAMGKPGYVVEDDCGEATVTETVEDTYIYCADADDSSPEGGLTIEREFAYLAVDCFGNETTASYVQTITVTDSEAPSFNEDLPGDITVDCESIPEAATLTATDNCDSDANVAFSEESSTTCAGIVRTWIASDDCGNTTTHVQNITVTDDEAPVITNMPADIIKNADTGVCSTTVNWDEPSATDNCTLESFTPDHISGDTYGVGETVVTYTAKDDCGNSTSLSFTITILDVEDPTIVNLPADITVINDEGICGAAVSWTPPTSADNCPGSSIAQTGGSASGSVFAVGETHTITYTATDDSGNDHSESFTITVSDAEAPVITAGAEEVVECDGAGNADEINAWLAANGGATATDNCIDVEWTHNYFGDCDVSEGMFTTFKQYAWGNAGEAEDMLVANFDAVFPDGVSLGCESGYDLIFTSPEAIDTYLPCYGTAQDLQHSGVDPSETSDPSCWNNILVSQLLTAKLNVEMDAALADFSAGDALLGNMVVLSGTFAGMSVNEVIAIADDVLGDCSDDYAPGAVMNALRDINENFNNGNVNEEFLAPAGCLYEFCGATGSLTVTFTATDDAGNSSSVNATLTIEDTTGPNIVLETATLNLDAEGNGTLTTNDVDAGSSDDCGSIVTSLSKTDFDCSDVGDNTVTFFAVDDCGNESEATVIVTVVDNVDPLAVTQDVTVQLDAAGNGSITADAVNNGSSDACGIGGLSLDQTNFDCSHVGTNTVTLTVTDVNGNESTATAIVTVVDNVAPVASAQDLTVQLASNGLGSILAAQVDNGSNDACGIADLTLSQTDFDCSHLGQNTVTLTVTDVNGNTDTAEATVTVVDLINPTAVAQAVTVELDDFGVGSITMDDIDNGSSDNCAVTGMSIDIDSFDCDDLGANMVTLTVVDQSGNASTAQATVTVVDLINPTPVVQAADVELDASGMGSITVDDIDNGSYDNCTVTSMSIDIDSFDCDDLGANTVTLTVVDQSGKTSTAQAIVTVQDLINPSALAQDVTVELDASGLGSITVDDIDNGSFDNCTVTSRSIDIDSFDCEDLGTHTVTLTVVDQSGNTSTAQATVTVQDNVAPTAVAQNVTVQLDEDGDGSTTADAVDNGSTDACGIASMSLSQTDFNCNHVGTNAVILTVTDVNGNVSTATATVTVEDNIPPVVITQNITVQLDSNGAASINDDAVDVLSRDACGIASMSTSQTNFDCTHVGPNTVTLTVTDNNGNVSTATATVTVEDNVDPTVVTQDFTAQLDADGNVSIDVDDIDNGSSDACGIASMSLDQSAFDCSHVGLNTVTLTVTDNNGNTSTAQATVTVQDNVAPTAVAQNVTVQLDEDGDGSTTADAVDNGSTDACGIASMSLSQTDFNCNHVGTNAVILTVTDVNGNVSTATATVTVEDNIPPVVITQNITVQLDSNGAASINDDAVDVLSRDACGIASMSTSQTNFDCTHVGPNTVTLTVTDNNGNVSTATATVTVEDNVDPTVVTQDFTAQLDADGNVSIDVDDIDNGSSDACGIASRSLDITSFTCADLGDHVVTLTVIDNNGNSSTATATVTVADSIAPTIDVSASNAEEECDGAGNTAALVAWLDSNGGATASDNCGPVTWENDFQTMANSCGGSGAVQVVFTASDPSGNESTTTATFTIIDTTSPDLIVPASEETVECDGSGNTDQLNAWLDSHGGASASDMCSDVTWSHNYGNGATMSDGCGATGSVEVTFTASDPCNNTVTTSAVFTIEDTTDPVASTTSYTLQLDANGDGTLTSEDIDQNSYDGCSDLTFTLSQAEFNCSHLGANTVTMTVEDECGRTHSADAIVTVEDKVAPTITVEAADETYECNGTDYTPEFTAWLSNFGNAVATDACGPLSWSHNSTGLVPGCGNSESETVTFTVTDGSGNSSTTTATFSVTDTAPPTIASEATDILLECNGDGNTVELNAWLVANGGAGQATDLCGDVTWSNNFHDFALTCSGTGAIEVIFTATDECGNAATTTASFTIEDTTAPEFTAEAADQTVECDGSGNVQELNAWIQSNGGATSEELCGNITWSNDFDGTYVTSSTAGSAEPTYAFGTLPVDAYLSDEDDGSNVATLPFTFTFYGRDYDLIDISTNGTISFNAAWGDDYDAYEFNWYCYDMIMGAHTDLDPEESDQTQISYGVVGTAPNRAYVISWHVVPNYMENDILHDAQIVLYEGTNVVEIFNAGHPELYPIDPMTVGIASEDCEGMGPLELSTEAWDGGKWTFTPDGSGGYAMESIGGGSGACNDNYEVTFTATDDCGNSASTVATFTIQDSTAPVALATDFAVDLDANGQATITVQDIDNGSYDVCGDVTMTLSKTEFNCYDIGDNIVTLTVEDECGETASATAHVNVTASDVDDPLLSNIPDDVTQNNDEGLCGANVTWVLPNISDNCHGSELSITLDDGSELPSTTTTAFFPVGTTTVTFTATDIANNNISESFSVTILDAESPEMTAAVDATVECNGIGNGDELQAWLASHGGATATDNCTSLTDLTWTNNFNGLSDDCGATGSVTVTFTVEDEAGNTSSTTATFTIEDKTNPSITTAFDELVECDGAGNAADLTAWLDSNGGATASDLCGGVSWSNDFVALSDECGATGSATVTFTATDDCGNTSSTTATFTIEDKTDPSITAASDELVECDGAGNAADLTAWLDSNGGATASDICGGVSWSNDFVALSDECGATGSATVTFTATDDCGNTSSTTATFTIEDKTDPSITAASDELVECDGAGNAADLTAWLDSNGGATASDICGGVSWSNDFVALSDECGATGSATVTFTATDDCGNTSSTTATFTIEDKTDPSITAASDELVECDGAGNAADLTAWLDSNGGATASDICGGVSWSNDFVALSDECGATGSATVTFTATDDCGNTSSTTATFTIEDKTDPSITAASDELVECDGAGNAADLTAWLDSNGGATASDICGGVSWSNDFVALSDECGATGSATVTFTATDDCGNTSSTTATFTIEDTTPPSMDTAASELTVECDGSGNQSDLDGWLNSNGGAAASDICGGVTWSNDFVGLSDDCGATGSATVIFTAIDDCGNSTSTTATFTIEDTSLPSMDTEASDLTVECDGMGNQSDLDGWLNSNGGAVASDICSGVTWANDFSGLSDLCGATGAATVTFTATDDCGHSVTTSATFTIEDTTPPAFEPYGGSQTVECDGNGNVEEIDAWLALVNSSTASDACGPITLEKTTTLLTDECAATGEASVSFLITDDCGNTTDTTLTFTIEDTQGPVFLTTAEDLTVECDGAGNTAALQNWLDTYAGATAEDVCGDFTWSHDFEGLTDDCGATGSRTVTFTATDECGNESHTSATFTIEDTIAPTIASEAIDMTVECDGSGNTAALNAWLASNGGAGEASDVCSGVTWSNDFTELSDLCGATGSATVIFTASDDCGNATTTTATFTIEDTTDPNIASPALDMTVECDGNGNLAELNAWLDSNGGAGAATDACSDPVAASRALSASDLMAPVTTNANWDRVATLTLLSNPNSNLEQTLDINITSMPAGARYRVLKTTANGSWYVAPAQDLNLGMNSITVSGVTFQRTVKVQFSDEETEFNSLTINGAQLLTASQLTGSSDLFSQGPNAWPHVFTAATLADPNGGDQQVLEINVLSLPDGGANYRVAKTTANGNWFNGPAQALSLGSNAIYTNAVNFQRAVKFQFDSGDIEFDSFVLNGQEQVTGGVTWSNDFVALSDDCGATGSATVTFTATDACGNTSSTTATFTIEDTLVPTMDIEASDLTVECDGAGNPTELNNWLDSNGGASASDECSGVTWSNDFTALSDLCGATGAATVTFTATDDCGHSTSTTATFTIEDTTAPVLTGDEVVIIDCSAWPWDPLYQPTIDELLTVVDTAGNPMITLDEACGYPNFPIDFGVMSGGCSYDHQLIYYPVDDCGNEGDSLYQVIQVDDFTDPEFLTVPADTMIACTEDVTVYLEMATAQDACDPSVNMTFEDEIVPSSGPADVTFTYTTDLYASSEGAVIITDSEGAEVVNYSSLPGFAVVEDVLTLDPGTYTITLTDSYGDGWNWASVSGENALVISGGATGSLDFTDGDEVSMEFSVQGGCPEVYEIHRTFYAEDCGYNIASVTQIISVADTAAPGLVLTAPADQAINGCLSSADLSEEVMGSVTWATTDDCGDVSVSYTTSDAYAYSCTANDPSNEPNPVAVTFTFTADYYAYEGAAYITDENDAVIENFGGFSSSTSDVYGLNLAPGTYTMTLTDSWGDGWGYNSTAGAGALVISGGASGSLDFSDGYSASLEFTVESSGGGPVEEGSHIVTRTFTVTAIDCAGNITEMSVDQIITITDNAAPTVSLTAPADLTVYLDASCDAAPVAQAVSGDATGFLVMTEDDCDTDVVYTVAHEDDTTYTGVVDGFGSFDILRTYSVTATDDCGNSHTETISHTIQVLDTISPELALTIPSDMALFSDAGCAWDETPANTGMASIEYSDGCSGSGPATADPGAASACSLFFSEYAEGSSNNKYLEIYNPTDEDIDLTGYAFPSVSNAPSTPGEYEYWNEFPEGASIAAGGTYIIAHGSADDNILAQADHTHAYLSNGDDGYILVEGTEDDYVQVDAIGDWNGDPGSGWDVAGESAATKDHTLRRKSDVSQGNGGDWTTSAGTDAANSEWIVLEKDYAMLNGYEGYGTHEFTGTCGDAPAPTDVNSTSITYTDEVTAYTASSCYTIERTWTATVTDNNGNATTASAVQTISVSDTDAPVITAESNTTASCDFFGFDLSEGSGASGDGDFGCSLFFSEYAEGSSNNKYLEIYNPTSSDIDLTGYAFPSVSNAPDTPGEYEYWNEFPEGASIAAGGTYIIAHPSADAGIAAEADHTHLYLSNGDDGYMLVEGTEDDYVQVDAIGDWNGDPGSGWDVAGESAATKDRTLRRKSDVTQGNGGDWTTSAGTDAANSEWIVLEKDYAMLNGYEGYGTHEFTGSCGGSATSLEVLMASGYVSFADNCELASMEAAITLDGEPCEGAYDIVYTATDSCGNTSTASQRIVLEDTVDPVLTVEQPGPVTMSAGADCNPDYIDGVPYPAASASDNCDADVAITATHFDGTKQYSCLPGTGAFTVLRTYTFTAVDNCGNEAVVSVSHNVTVVDDIDPTFTVEAPADKTVNLDAFCSANTSTTITGMPDVTDVADNCDSDVDVTITHTDSDNVYTCDGSDGSADGSYTFERTFTITATDDCGNETVEMVSHTITVLDVTNPTITAIAPMAVANYTLDAACTVDVTPASNPLATAIDACDSDVSISFDYIDSEPTNTCDGADGSADGSYTFTRTWTITAMDDCGNSTSQQTSQTVVVTDDAAPSLMSSWPADYTTDLDASCNADLSVDAAGAATATADDACDTDVSIDITSEDGAITYMAVNADDVAEGGYHFTRTWTVTATDDCGNVTIETHGQLITANDVIAPTQELETLPTYSVEGCYGEVDLDPSVTGTPTVSAEDGCDSQVDIDLTYATDDLVFNELFGNYNLILDTISGPEDGVLGMTTVRMYIETENEDDFVSAVAGDAVNPTGIRTTTSFYQNVLGGASAGSYNEFSTMADPLMAYDSWVTIGIDQQADALAGEVETTVVGDWATEFEAGGNILISDFFGGSWFTTNPNSAAIAGADHRVLLGQFTTDGQMSGQVFVQVFPQGLGSEEMRLSFTFGDCAEDDDTPEGSYAFTRRWESVVTDDADNSSTAVTYQHIQVLDTEAPQLTNTCSLNNGETVSHNCPGIGVLDFDPVPVACDVTAIDNCDSEVNVTLFTETEGYIPTDEIRNYCAPVTPEAHGGAQTCDDRAPEVIRLFNFPGADDSFVMADGDNLIQVMSDGAMHIEIEVENADGSGGFVFTADYGAGQDWATWSAGGSNYKKDCAEIYPGQSIWEDWVYFLMTAGTLEGTGMYAGSSFTLSHQPANGYYGMQMGLGANNKNTNYGGSAWFFWQGNLMMDGVDMGPMASSGDVYMDLDCCLPWQVDYYYTALDDCGNPTGFSYSEAMGSDLEDGDAAVSGGHTGGPIDITSVGGIKEPIRITGLAPNPTNDMSQLSFVVSENMRLRVDLYTMGGTLVQEMYEGNAMTGVQYVMNIDADALSDGMYQVRISSNSYLAVKKLLVAN